LVWSCFFSSPTCSLANSACFLRDSSWCSYIFLSNSSCFLISSGWNSFWCFCTAITSISWAFTASVVNFYSFQTVFIWSWKRTTSGFWLLRITCLWFVKRLESQQPCSPDFTISGTSVVSDTSTLSDSFTSSEYMICLDILVFSSTYSMLLQTLKTISWVLLAEKQLQWFEDCPMYCP